MACKIIKWLTGVVSHLICGVITSRGPPCVCMNSLDITLPQPWGSSGPADSNTMTKGVYESRRIAAGTVRTSEERERARKGPVARQFACLHVCVCQNQSMDI